MTITIQSFSAEIIADPGRFADWLRAGEVVISDLTYEASKKLAHALGLAEEEDMDTVSLGPDQMVSMTLCSCLRRAMPGMHRESRSPLIHRILRLRAGQRYRG
jgi:hypothetical protein